MKKYLLLFYVVLLSYPIYGQEVQFPPAVISSGGSFYSNSPVYISRWRIGDVRIVSLPENVKPKEAVITSTSIMEDKLSDWTPYIYPNPVEHFLKVRFEMEREGSFAFELLDATGRKMFVEHSRNILPGAEVEFNVSQLTPSLYLLRIVPSGEENSRLFKIIKQ